MKSGFIHEKHQLLKQCEAVASLLKQLSHPERLAILCHLSDSERTVSELESLCKSSQSQVSQFLTRMKAERLVAQRREGKFVYYRITDSSVSQLIQALQKVFCK